MVESVSLLQQTNNLGKEKTRSMALKKKIIKAIEGNGIAWAFWFAGDSYQSLNDQQASETTHF